MENKKSDFWFETRSTVNGKLVRACAGSAPNVVRTRWEFVPAWAAEGPSLSWEREERLRAKLARLGVTTRHRLGTQVAAGEERGASPWARLTRTPTFGAVRERDLDAAIVADLNARFAQLEGELVAGAGSALKTWEVQN